MRSSEPRPSRSGSRDVLLVGGRIPGEAGCARSPTGLRGCIPPPSYGARMSHRNTLNQLTENVANLETWEDAVAELHRALQIVGIVLDELEERVKSLEAPQDGKERS
jgi:hypothetical protein